SCNLYGGDGPQRQCLNCYRTLRVYLAGVKHAPTRHRLEDLPVTLYWLRISYKSVPQALETLSPGPYLKHLELQAAGQPVAGIKRRYVFAGQQTSALGANLTGLPARNETPPDAGTVNSRLHQAWAVGHS